MKVFAIAGEPSGDALGGALLGALAEMLGPAEPLELAGVGGTRMAEAGLASLFAMDELSVMGLAEVLPRYPALRRRALQTVAAAIAARPDVLLTIDSPDFCLPVARRVRAALPGVRTVHYVAPSVWAWRKGRARRMAGVIDQVLALLPFEPPYMEAAGIACDFVGHPVAAEPVAGPAEGAAFRAAHGIGASETVIVVLPGSRRGEVGRLGPIFGEALRPVLETNPRAHLVLPAAAPVAEAARAQAASWPGRVVLLDPRGRPPAEAAAEKRAAFAAADVALAASGTVSLELAAARVPTVIGYDMNWLTYQILSRMVSVPSATLVNLVADELAIPEFLGPDCTPGNLAAALLRLLVDPAARAEQARAQALCMERLGAGGPPPGERAARAVLRGLGRG